MKKIQIETLSRIEAGNGIPVILGLLNYDALIEFGLHYEMHQRWTDARQRESQGNRILLKE